MIDRKKAIRDYKNIVRDKGIFAIRNTQNGKVYLASTLNLYSVFERNKFQLTLGSHTCKPLQKDWQACGENSFVFEVLEKLPLKDDPAYDYDEDLKILEMIWIEKFRPFSEHCYNENETIRKV